MAENYITKQEERGTVNISEDVIAVMVSAAVSEVDGIAGFGNATTPELVELFGRKNSPKGLKIRFVDEKITIDVMVNVKLGGSITDIAVRVQDNVCREVESVTGMSAVVNVHVTGVSFDK
jgi:uncharacterized alkaline shock family protein YloU